MRSAAIAKQIVSSEERMRALLSRFEPAIQRAFMEMVRNMRDQTLLDEFVTLLEQGSLTAALSLMSGSIGQFAAVIATQMILSGSNTAELISEELDRIISFDQVNENAVRAIRQTRLTLITQITNVQRDAIQEILRNGIERGLNPRQLIPEIRQNIGLTARQIQAVNNYRTLLEQGNAQALDRELRDRRFDSTVRRALRGEALTQEQIDRMVQRYAERQLSFRAEVIARTEALRAVHEGSELMYSQAIDEGVLDRQRLSRTWLTARDTRVRDSHNGMNGQTKAYGEKFVTDDGNLLSYPGDPSAPAYETIQCRCVITTRYNPPAAE